MAEWSVVILLILLGLALVIVEVIFIPGTTLVGVGGIITMVIGIIVSFKYFGAETGWITLGGSTAASGVLLYLAFRTNMWKRFALNTTIDGKVNEIEGIKFAVGMEGVALSALRPFGTGEFGGNTAEVRTLGEYVATGSRIRIVKVSVNQIIVEIIN